MKTQIDTYLAHVRERLSPKTHLTYQTVLTVFLQIVGEDAPLDKNTYVAFLKKTTDINPSTQKLCRSAIKQLYLFFFDETGVHSDSLKQADKQYALRSEYSIPDIHFPEIKKVLSFVQALHGDLSALRDKAFILTLADSGLRIFEACSLRVGQINWNEYTAIIKGKGNRKGLVNFSNRSMFAMRAYLASRQTLDGATGKPLTSLPVFARHDKRVSDKIKPIGTAGMWYAVKGRIQEAGVDPNLIRIHDFRHYFVSVAYASSGNLKLAQLLARHKHIEMTGHYAHLVNPIGQEYDKIFNR